jgi:hypothetical protein
MAEQDFDTIKDAYDKAKQELDLYDVSVSSEGTYTVNGTVLSASEFGKRKKAAKTKFDAINKKYKKARQERGAAAAGAKQAKLALQSQLAAIERDNREIAGNIASGNVGGMRFGGDIAKAQAAIDENNKKIASIKKELGVTETPATASPDYVDAAMRAASPVSADAAERRAGFVYTDQSIKNRATTVDRKPKEDTTGGGGGGGGGGTDKTKKPALPKNWEAQFRRMFPEQSWLLDLDKTKYPKLFALIQRGISDRMYETAEGQQRFAAELKNTDFYVELRDTDKVRQIKSLVGDLGFDSVPFNKFLTTASNMGWEGETLQQEVYKEAFRKNDTGQYVNPTAVTRAKASNNYLAIANIGKAYFSQVADSTVENALTGGITNEDVQRQQRELAKTKYGHLSNLIEQGLTLQELSSPFQQQAASILERSTDSIDMGQAMFEAAYNYGETGQKRMMTSGEWEILLRSDAKYGWDKTENAKREARQLASSISQAFGKVM